MGEPSPKVVPETSSAPLAIPEEQEFLFRRILTLLQDSRVPYAVAGAFALRAHTGIYRDTKDLDLFLTAEDAAGAMIVLREEGFHCEICDPVWLLKAHQNGYYVDLITGMSNAAIEVEQSWIQRSVPAVVYDVPTRVLAAEELLASKLFVTRRERFDGADIAHVIYGSQGKLDWQRVLELAGEHWEMLLWALILFRYAYPAQTHFVPMNLWHDLLCRFEHVVAHPDMGAKFRGSLVDERMFAIDLREWGLENVMQEYRERRLQSLPAIYKEL